MKTRRIRWGRRHVMFESLEPRQLLSAVGFMTHEIVVADTDGLSALKPADLDGDGDMDVLSASRGDDKIAWYENTDGKGTFAAQQAITTDADGAVSVAVGDLDGDGDLDVLSASTEDDTIAWYENVDGNGTFGPEQVITVAAEGALSIAIGDLDGDGDLDLLSAPWRKTIWGPFRCQSGEVSWYENIDGSGSFGPQQVIATGPNLASVSVADLDGDRDLDVVVSSHLYKSCTDTFTQFGDSTLAWYENTNNAGNFGPEQVIAKGIRSHLSTMTGDVDSDGDLDVLIDGAWFENTDAAGTFGQEKVIREYGHLLWADFDGDDDLDALTNDAWYENTDGAGTFGSRMSITPRNEVDLLAVADLDLDGDLDLLTASEERNRIAWHEWYEFTEEVAGGFVPERVTTIDAAGVHSLTVGDVDGDGDLDIVSTSRGIWNSETGVLEGGNVAWYENIQTSESFGSRQVISLQAASSATVGDVDGDGDLDVVTTGEGGIVWYANTDGRGNFGQEQVIRADVSNSVRLADLDGDGDLDLLANSIAGASFGAEVVSWYENTDGAGSFGPEQQITIEGGRTVTIGDLDGDGDLDVVSGRYWFENIEETGSFAPGQPIAALGMPWFVFGAFGLPSTLADLDSDGDLDILMASGWFENTDGKGSFPAWNRYAGPSNESVSITVGDLDGDGDLDVVRALSGNVPVGVFVDENVDGAGTFGRSHTIVPERDAVIFQADTVAVADFDGDGDLDVVYSGTEYEDGVGIEIAAIAWNTIRSGRFGEPQVINSPGPGAHTVVAVGDLDGDGDLDVLSAASDRQLSWFENADGATSFQRQREIPLPPGFVEPVFITVADLDGDGDQDVVSGYRRSSDKTYLAWHENQDGAGGFEVSMINAEAEGAHYVTSSDLDGDGDVDLIASLLDNGIAWYENTDGAGGFSPQRVIAAQDFSRSVSVGDLDGDGDMDVVSASDADIVWYENTDEAGTFGTRQVIGLEEAGRSLLTVGDVDGDGDLDVVLLGIGWYENEDGVGSFGPQQAFPLEDVLLSGIDGDGDRDVLSTSRSVDYRYEGLGDFDGDGDLDIVTAADDKIVWSENRLAGDANDDGQVEFADFLTLSDRFGQTNAVWEDGDFNGDETVNFADFLILSENFGESRPRIPRQVSTSALQTAATSKRQVLATDGFFERMSSERGDQLKADWVSVNQHL